MPEHPPLRPSLQQHLELIAARSREQTQLPERLAAIVARLEDEQTTQDVVSLIQDIVPLQPKIHHNISILVSLELQDAYDYLAEVYQIIPATVTQDSKGTIQHAVLYTGHDEFWLHPESSRFLLASPHTLGGSTATTAVLVDDVDEHYRHTIAAGADVRYEPTDQSYGFREYSATDLEGHLWLFMRPLS